MLCRHQPSEACRSPEATRKIDHLIATWWDSPSQSGQRTELEETMRYLTGCPRCRSTLADRVIDHGIRNAEARMVSSEAALKRQSYLAAQRREALTFR